jgi:hypothetical protein
MAEGLGGIGGASSKKVADPLEPLDNPESEVRVRT